MGLSIVNVTRADTEASSWAVQRENGVYPLTREFESHTKLMDCYFSNRSEFEAAVAETPLTCEFKFNSPITKNIQLICQGLNYADHRAESGAKSHEDSQNLIFLKAPSSISAPNDPIIRPKNCQLLDYEIELALVLKQSILEPLSPNDTKISDYVGGLVLCNDVSARDEMFGASMLQWYRGKSHRTFCPMGPVLYLLDPEDFNELFAMELTLKLNGEVKQSASTDQLIHRPLETLCEISSFADVTAGDCLLTGTPGGVLAGANLKVGLSILLNFQNDTRRREKFTQAQLTSTRFLEPGDVLELSIKSASGAIDLGTQRSEIADA